MINSEMTFDYSEVVQKLSEPLRKKVERSIDLLRKAEKLALAYEPNRKTDANCFKTITDKMLDTYKAKNQDYGNSFSNLFKECGMTYAYGHMAEKLERVKSLMEDEAKVKGEGMKDSLKDLANYAILTIMELERKEEK